MANPFQIFGGMMKAGGQKMLSPFEQMVHSQRIRSFLEAMKNSPGAAGTMVNKLPPLGEDYGIWLAKQAANRKVWW